MKRWLALVVFAVFAVVVGSCLISCLVTQRAERLGIEKAEALFRGDQSGQLEAIEMYYQQRRVRCSDPEALRYFEGCLQQSNVESLRAGSTYMLRFQFVGGESLEVVTYWGDGGFKLYMPYQATDNGTEPRIRIRFTSPMPASVKEMIDFLHDDSKSARGVVLILEAGGVRREHDPSLIQ